MKCFIKELRNLGMLSKTAPDSVQNSFGDGTQEPGQRIQMQHTSDNFTIVATQNQAISGIFCEPFIEEDFGKASLTSGKYVGTGNRCGHDPLNFRDITYINESNRPKVIQWAMRNIREYFINPDKFPSELKSLNKPLKGGGGHRQTRTEGRESLMSMGLMLFYYLELSTMTVRKDDIVFNNMTMQELTGNSLSLSRAYRALQKLVALGFVKVTRQFQQAHNLFAALASVKEITYKFFNVLKLGKHYSFSKSFKEKVLEKRDAKEAKRKRPQKQNAMQQFDAYLPDRSVIFKRASNDNKTLQVVTTDNLEAMRREVIKHAVARCPEVESYKIENVVYKYSYEALKRELEHYRSQPPP